MEVGDNRIIGHWRDFVHQARLCFASLPCSLCIASVACFTSPNGMKCVPMGKHNVYIDKTSVTQEQANGCTSRKGCKSAKGTWQRAAEICSYLGKRLPTVDEFKAAGITDVVWSRNRDSRTFKKRTCADGVKECPYSSRHLLSNGTIQHDSKRIAQLPYCASDNHILATAPAYVIDEAISHYKSGIDIFSLGVEFDNLN